MVSNVSRDHQLPSKTQRPFVHITNGIQLKSSFKRRPDDGKHQLKFDINLALKCRLQRS